MEKFDLLKVLLNKLENYYESTDNLKDYESFIIWLNMHQQQNLSTTNLSNNNKFGGAEKLTQDSVSNIDNGIGILNGLMYRYSRMYSKVALEHTSKLSLEEFTFLATLSSFEGCTKTELINTMIFEKSTGIEIIKRLVNAKLVSEEVNSGDKRSKLLKLSDKGRVILFSTFSQMEIVSKEITKVLDESEKKALHYILMKLENYHRTHIDSNLENLRKQLIGF
ncbi:hypothetical protein A5893_02425 [Pedobacter psychrophilus]|uniref:HTH marR-type domain-containing protein n=1 Tax=Pedobacter psychrophilus TaxID=1826909 RepID=A0A179DLN0_9SPHI|nr:MarR family winged helix-turn-helix transcriptional regulator [Pedobacter psychrophilus]OAQ41996.1 hypothetical protein A5893_02425 [Pedobacter psychrophilus]